MLSRKRSHCFAITFNNVDWKKSDLGNWLLIDNDNKPNEIAIGEEKYHPPLD
jgi:hypothetical protein